MLVTSRCRLCCGCRSRTLVPEHESFDYSVMLLLAGNTPPAQYPAYEECAMRTWMAVGASILVMVVGSQAAQARGGRGFARLFSGHAHPSYRSVALNQSSGANSEPKAGILSYRPALVLAPGPAASVVAPSAALPAISAEAPAPSERIAPIEPVAQPVREETPRLEPVREVRAHRPSCAPGRTVGGSGNEGTGFCLIN